MAFVEAPTALPYIAAIERMTRANLTLLKLVAMLALYCFIFVLPLIGVLAIHTVLQNRATHVLARIQKLVYRWFYRWVFPVFRVIIIALGVVLILDSFTQLFGASII
jgi:cytochrome c biogenesis protein CcdA